MVGGTRADGRLRQEPSGAAAPPEKELDLDELLDVEDDAGRRRFLQRFLEDAAAAPDAVTVSSPLSAVRRPLCSRLSAFLYGNLDSAAPKGIK